MNTAFKRSRGGVLAVLLIFFVVTAHRIWLDLNTAVQDSSQFQCAHWSVFRCCQLLGVPVDRGDLLKELPPKDKGHSMLQMAGVLKKIQEFMKWCE